MCHCTRSFARSFTFFIIFEKNTIFKVLYSYLSRSLHLWCACMHVCTTYWVQAINTRACDTLSWCTCVGSSRARSTCIFTTRGCCARAILYRQHVHAITCILCIRLLYWKASVPCFESACSVAWKPDCVRPYETAIANMNECTRVSCMHSYLQSCIAMGVVHNFLTSLLRYSFVINWAV